MCMHFQGGLSVAREKKTVSVRGERAGRAADEGMHMQSPDGG